MQWYAKEVEENLPLELDFKLEASNSARCKKILSFNSQYKVPDVYCEHSGKRVLTMEFVEGISIGDV
jgi:predicted unusual protein kinase regulating ubiquinone biosynthesis (AarF/ABC1/UbiB family)